MQSVPTWTSLESLPNSRWLSPFSRYCCSKLSRYYDRHSRLQGAKGLIWLANHFILGEDLPQNVPEIHLFYFFVLQKVPMRTSVIIKSTPKFSSASCVLFMTGFISKKVNYVLRMAIQILWSDGIYVLRRWWFKLLCFGNMFTNFTAWFVARTTETFNWF